MHLNLCLKTLLDFSVDSDARCWNLKVDSQNAVRKNALMIASHSSGSGPNCLNIMYFNAQSLLPKMDKLRALVDTQNPHIVCIVETCLSNDISDNEVSLEGYQVICLDRNRHGGGILIFVHDSLVSKVVMAGPSSLELLIISVSNHVNTCKHHLGLFIALPPVVYLVVWNHHAFLVNIDFYNLSYFYILIYVIFFLVFH